FQRAFIDSATQGLWRWVIPDRAVVTDNFVYDWRLGVPALMQTIAMRLQVIAAEDPNFRTDSIFAQELSMHRAALKEHMQKMIAGIRCGWREDREPSEGYPYTYEFTVACADINTGASEVQRIDYAQIWPLDWSSCTHCQDSECWTDDA